MNDSLAMNEVEGQKGGKGERGVESCCPHYGGSAGDQTYLVRDRATSCRERRGL